MESQKMCVVTAFDRITSHKSRNPKLLKSGIVPCSITDSGTDAYIYKTTRVC